MPDEDIYFDQPTYDSVPAEYVPEDAQVADEAVRQEAPTEEPLSFNRRLIMVQRKLKAPKSQFNSYGGYAYRNCEDILEALKPLLDEYGMLLSIDDELVFLEGRFYIKATATVTDIDTGESRCSHAYAREPENRKGSDQSQVTGSCSSYARKFALNALFLIDDTKDADTPPKQEKQKPKEPPASGPFVARCANCGTQYQFQDANQYHRFIANPGCCNNPQWGVV